MTDSRTRRQEIYDRIRESSKDEVILEEMIRLGFWPKSGEMPHDPAEEIRRRGLLERELHDLVAEQRQLGDAEAMKRALHKQRLEESRRKRQETKQRKLEERKQRAENWRRRKQTEIVYLGDGVSTGLNQRQSDERKLSSRGLPVVHHAADLADEMGVTVAELRFLAFSRRTSTISHYAKFAIPKKTGGLREISAPRPRLKRAQHWILQNVLDRVPLHRAAHGFRRGRSIVTGAEPHVGADVVINVDIEDFFPTITYRRIRGMFRSLGYSEAVATLFSLICSEPKTAEVQLDGRTYFVLQGERVLPQGAPTSPAITNIICRGLDSRLLHISEQLGFTYTRYADDMTFSGSGEASDHVGRMLRRIRFVVEREGFKLHPKKTRILRRGRRQEVTGLVVNEKLAVPRRELRRFRAVLFQIEKDGPAGKRWGQSGDVMSAIEGYANFVAMVDADKGEPLKQRVQAIFDRFGYVRPTPRPPVRASAEEITEFAAAEPVPWWRALLDRLFGRR